MASGLHMLSCRQFLKLYNKAIDEEAIARAGPRHFLLSILKFVRCRLQVFLLIAINADGFLRRRTQEFENDSY